MVFALSQRNSKGRTRCRAFLEVLRDRENHVNNGPLLGRYWGRYWAAIGPLLGRSEETTTGVLCSPCMRCMFNRCGSSTWRPCPPRVAILLNAVRRHLQLQAQPPRPAQTALPVEVVRAAAPPVSRTPPCLRRSAGSCHCGAVSGAPRARPPHAATQSSRPSKSTDWPNSGRTCMVGLCTELPSCRMQRRAGEGHSFLFARAGAM